MKTKLLTICLLLVTSQVFAKDYKFQSCPDKYSAQSCDLSKCGVGYGKYQKKIARYKVNVANQKVIQTLSSISVISKKMETWDVDDLGECTVFDKKNWACNQFYDPNNRQRYKRHIFMNNKLISYNVHPNGTEFWFYCAR